MLGEVLVACLLALKLTLMRALSLTQTLLSQERVWGAQGRGTLATSCWGSTSTWRGCSPGSPTRWAW